MEYKINSVEEFMKALGDRASLLEIQTSLLFPFSITLPPGTRLKGREAASCILSFANSDGIALTADNEISDLTIQTGATHRAVYALSDRENLGVLRLNRLVVTGQIQLLIRAGTKRARVVADQVDIVSCDSRKYSEQPQKYGVNVYQGAFTVYNFNSDDSSVVHATLTDISLGRKGAPVIGSGLFVAGFGDRGGRVEVDRITTLEIHSNGMIPYGTPNMITGGVFIVNGVHVRSLVHKGSVTTYGVNDMVLDAWGVVDHWIVEKPVVSYGPSGIGFVNFGTVGDFEARDRIETFGAGARGFNQYDGTVKRASFSSITTHGHGSVGIQVSKPVGTIEVLGRVQTYGKAGPTLVKGVVMDLPANGVSVKSGGNIEKLILKGGIITHGDQVTSLEIEGRIGNIEVQDIVAEGQGATGVLVSDGGQSTLSEVSVRSLNGPAVRIKKGGQLINQTGLRATGAQGNILQEK